MLKFNISLATCNFFLSSALHCTLLEKLPRVTRFLVVYRYCFHSKGSSGLPGRTGLPGPPGLKGEKGSQGPLGPRGSIGEKGEAGPAGMKGEAGDKGHTGDRGEAGERGDEVCIVTYVVGLRFNFNHWPDLWEGILAHSCLFIYLFLLLFVLKLFSF